MGNYSSNPLKAIKELGLRASNSAGISKKSSKKNDNKAVNKNVNSAVKKEDKTSDKKASKKQSSNKQASKKQVLEKPVSKKQTMEKPVSKKQTIEKPVSKKQTMEKPVSKKQAIEKNGSKKQALEKQDSKKQDSKKQLAVKSKKKKGSADSIESVNKAGNTNIVNKENTANKENKAVGKVKIIPLGGLEQIGLNITAFEYGDTIIVVDCGIAFPTEEMPGIDLVIPDITYLKENESKVRAFFITHGHEDHIGALPYVLKDMNIPVYATKLTKALIEHKLEENGLLEGSKVREVRHGETVKAGDFAVEFIKTNHSIQDASALAIFSPAGILFHTGDFKIDYTPIFGEPANLQRIAEIGNMGCLALLCDSTNAGKKGSTPSEKAVGSIFDAIFAEHRESRIMVATFASNVDRVQQVINTAYKFGRKVVIEGRSMIQVIEIAQKLGYISIPEGTLIDIEQLKNYRLQDTVIITTGSQGESMAALARMASGAHKKVIVCEGDIIVLSSMTIPGNEKAVSKIINDLYRKGAKVIVQNTHVSGHACEEDIKLIYSLIKPKYAIPVHGEYRHLVAQKEIAKSVGMDPANIMILSSGDVLELSDEEAKVTGQVQTGAILVDGLGVGDVGTAVLKDRQNLAQNGIIIVSMCIDSNTNELIAGPEIYCRGFIYVQEAEDIIEEARNIVKDKMYSIYDMKTPDINKMKAEVREALRSYFWKTMKRTPVIMPIILQAEV